MKTCLPEARWYILYTYPNSERKVTTHLTRSQFESFLPLQKVVRQWSDRKKTIEVPLFPNYVFLLAEPPMRYRALETPGVLKFVSFDGQPVFVSHNEIDLIRRLVHEDASLTVENRLQPGDHVRITSGAFAGLQGVLFERKGQKRFGLQISAINQTLSIEISAQCVERVGHS